MEMRYNRCHST